MNNEVKPRVLILWKPLCQGCADAEVYFGQRGFAVRCVNAETPKGADILRAYLVFKAEADQPIDGLTFPVFIGEGWGA